MGLFIFWALFTWLVLVQAMKLFDTFTED